MNMPQSFFSPFSIIMSCQSVAAPAVADAVRLLIVIAMGVLYKSDWVSVCSWSAMRVSIYWKRGGKTVREVWPLPKIYIYRYICNACANCTTMLNALWRCVCVCLFVSVLNAWHRPAWERTFIISHTHVSPVDCLCFSCIHTPTAANGRWGWENDGVGILPWDCLHTLSNKVAQFLWFPFNGKHCSGALV